MIQQVISGGDSPKHFPDVSGGFCFVKHAFGTCAGKAALRCCGHFDEPEEAHSRRTCASICGSASIPQHTLPIRSGKTKRKRPARVFLSACMAAIKRAGEALGQRGREPTRAIRCKIRPESFVESRPLATASLVAAIIPQPTASP